MKVQIQAPTYESHVRYWLSSAFAETLEQRFGEYLEQLTAREKLTIVKLLAQWQGYSTDLLVQSSRPSPFAEVLESDGLMQQWRDFTPRTQAFVTILKSQNLGKQDGIALLTALSHQLNEGVVK